MVRTAGLSSGPGQWSRKTCEPKTWLFNVLAVISPFSLLKQDHQQHLLEIVMSMKRDNTYKVLRTVPGIH